ncbi:hypothetical protein CR513_10710, partial [Mucuna pruriens]
MCCVLGQQYTFGKKGQAIYYLNKKFTDYEQRLSKEHLDPSRRVFAQEKPSRPDRFPLGLADSTAQQFEGAKWPKCSGPIRAT